MSPNALDPVTLGIDLGSTSTRAYLWNPITGTDYPVENNDRDAHSSTRFEAGDFSSIGYPFTSNGPVYRGDMLYPQDRPISLKYAPYALANASDELLEQYPLVQDIMARKDDPIFRGRLHRGLMELLSRISIRAEEVCRANDLSITKIGLSIPSQWTLEFEEVYRELVVATFAIPEGEIYFHTETEALAHFLFKAHSRELRKHLSGTHDVVLFLDFGGHNMNSCIFNVVHGKDAMPSFYRVGDCIGAGGGGEHWEYNIGKKYCEKIMRAGADAVSPEDKQAFLDYFTREKQKNLGPGQGGSLSLLVETNGMMWRLSLNSENINRCFQDALQRPLAVAAAQMDELLWRVKTVPRRIIVSGRTCRTEALQSNLIAMCAKRSLPPPIFTQGLQMKYDCSIARGAALIVGDSLTVEKFLQRGAAFGIQMKQCATRGNTNPYEEWDASALFLLDNNHQERGQITVTGLDQLKLVCDPFPRAEEGPRRLNSDKCYDILDLSKPMKGTWVFELFCRGSGDDMSLTIRRWRKPSKRKLKQFVDERVFPLYVDKGSNCAHIGARGRSLEDIGLSPTPYLDEDNPGSLLQPTDGGNFQPGVQNSTNAPVIETQDGEESVGPVTQPLDDRVESITAGEAQTSSPRAGSRCKPSGSLMNKSFDPRCERRKHPYKRPQQGVNDGST